MRTFIILVVVCLMSGVLATPLKLTDEQKALVKTHFDECVKQESVSEADATRLRNRDFEKPSDSMKCFGTCFFEKVGTLKDGKVQEEVVLKKLNPLIGEEKTKEVLDLCKDIEGSDRCDTGFKTYECFENYKAKVDAKVDAKEDPKVVA